ncbi:thiamine-phosphate pyrophosphorylase [Nitratifractor sp.]
MTEQTREPDRVIDANLNRLREGLRVLEDLHRYLLDDAEASRTFKALRHRLKPLRDPARIVHREIEGDVGKATTDSERRRADIADVAAANFSRAQESARVLEELFKLVDPRHAQTCKEIRYELYRLEKAFILNHSNRTSSTPR